MLDIQPYLSYMMYRQLLLIHKDLTFLFYTNILLSHRISHLLQQLLLRQDAATNTHRFEFLEQELVRVRDLNRAEIRRVTTTLTEPDTLLRIRDSEQAAIPARPASEQVGALHETLFRELRDTVRRDAITLHLAKTESTFTRAPLSRLPRQHNQRS